MGGLGHEHAAFLDSHEQHHRSRRSLMCKNYHSTFKILPSLYCRSNRDADAAVNMFLQGILRSIIDSSFINTRRYELRYCPELSQHDLWSKF